MKKWISILFLRIVGLIINAHPLTATIITFQEPEADEIYTSIHLVFVR